MYASTTTNNVPDRRSVVIHYVEEEGMELAISQDKDGVPFMVEGIIHGPPISKPSPRVCKNGHVYNPLRAKMAQAKTQIRSMLEPTGLLNGSHGTVFVNEDIPLKLSVKYMMPRPLSEFVGGDRDNNLKSTARHPHSVAAKDGDNLTKYLV